MMKVSGIVHILKRIPISPGQLSLLKVLYFADQPLTLNSIAFMMRRGHLEGVIGILGALTNRIAWTEDVGELPDPAYLVFFDVEIVNGVEHFTMCPELRAAIDQISKLRKVIQNFTVDEIYERYDHGEPYWLDIRP